MMRTILFLVGFQYINCSGLLYKKDVYVIHDLLQSSPIFSKSADTALHCAIICGADTGCMNYIFDHINSVCLGYGNRPPSFEIVLHKDATKTMTSFRTMSDGKSGCEENGYFLNENNGRCWRYCTIRMKFNDAVQACKDTGGSPITHVTKAEAIYINSIHNLHGYLGGWYLGMTDRKKEGTWLWLDGTKSTFNFPSGADNDFDGAFPGKGADCAIVHKATNAPFDVYCGAKYSFVCERKDLI